MMAWETHDRPLNIKGAFASLLETLDCDYVERNGEVWILTPEKLLWRYSIPYECTGASLSPDLEKWVTDTIERRRF